MTCKNYQYWGRSYPVGSNDIDRGGKMEFRLHYGASDDTELFAELVTGRISDVFTL